MSIQTIPTEWAYWFTGLCDGEASFTFTTQWPNQHIHPRLAVCMQQDDELLREIHAVFGFGSLCLNHPSCKRSDGSGFQPRATWSVDKRSDLQSMCDFFDAFPLRSKKRAEFELWRPLVTAYCRDTHTFSELVALAMKLSALNERRSGFLVRARTFLAMQQPAPAVVDLVFAKPLAVSRKILP